MPNPFRLHERLAADTVFLCSLSLSDVLLMNDARFPWLILVPRRAGLTEIVDLDPQERAILMEEIAAASRALRASFPCDKLNIGALGNMVAQLHVHVVARIKDDAAWPGPVWGSGAAKPYDAAWSQSVVEALRKKLSES